MVSPTKKSRKRVGSKMTESHSLPKSLKTKLRNKETMSCISRSVEKRVQSSSFLLEHEQETTSLVQLEPKNIQLGIHIGEGAFSDVYQVQAAALPLATTRHQSYAIKIPKDPEKEVSHQCSKVTSLLQRFVGRGLQVGRSKSNLSGGNQEQEENHKVQVYTQTCIDLILEGKHLAAMDHPNIIKVRAFAVPSPEASPFLVMDRLIDTLDKRIEQWRSSKATSLRGNHCSRSTSAQDHPSPPRRWKTMSKFFRFRSCARKMIDSSLSSFCSGSSTRSASSILLEEDPMDLLQERTTYALQIAQALQYLHRHRIILRDLKPSNVGFIHCPLSGKDVVQLFDFGLCRELPPPLQDSATCANDDDGYDDDCNDEFHMSISGTTRYMAPEIITQHGMYGLKADMYSWGVLTYEMLTLEPPYASVCSTLKLHMRFVFRDGVRPIFPDHDQYLRDETLAPYLVPQTVQRIIETSWDQDIFKRPTASELCYRLQSFLENNFSTSTTTAAPLPATSRSPAITNESEPKVVLSGTTPTPRAPPTASSSSTIIPPTTQPLSLIDAMISQHQAELLRNNSTSSSPRTASNHRASAA